MDLINKKPTFDGGLAESNPNLDPETAHRLNPLAERFAFIPLSGKIPLIKGWPKSKGYSINDLLKYQNCSTIGARTGLFTGPLLCFDLDGESAWYWLKSRGMVLPETWIVARSNDAWRRKLLFQPSNQQINQLTTGEFTYSQKTGDKEQIECFFMGGRQIAILGKHPSGGSYLWPDGFGPERLAPPPDDWWDLTVEFSKKFDRKRPISSAITSSGDWVRTSYCEICNRNERTICSKHKDGNSIRCFHGGTFRPPTGLKAGDLIDPTWAYVRDQVVDGIGLFSIFVRHKPSPAGKLWRHRSSIHRSIKPPIRRFKKEVNHDV